VLLGLRIPILLGHAKVDNVDDIGGFGARAPNEEIVRLDVSVDQVLLVDRLNPGELQGTLVSAADQETMDTTTHHLLCNHHCGLDGESPVAVVKEILETGAEQVDDEDVVQTLLAKVVDIGDAGYGSQHLLHRTGRGHLRHPTRILYVRYSSRS